MSAAKPNKLKDIKMLCKAEGGMIPCGFVAASNLFEFILKI